MVSDFVVVAHARVRPESRAEFMRLAAAVEAETRPDPDCLGYNLYEDPDDPGSFVVIEEWRTSEAVMGHVAQPYVQDFLARVGTMVIDPPSVVLLSVQERRALL